MRDKPANAWIAVDSGLEHGRRGHYESAYEKDRRLDLRMPGATVQFSHGICDSWTFTCQEHLADFFTKSTPMPFAGRSHRFSRKARRCRSPAGRNNFRMKGSPIPFTGRAHRFSQERLAYTGRTDFNVKTAPIRVRCPAGCANSKPIPADRTEQHETGKFPTESGQIRNA